MIGKYIMRLMPKGFTLIELLIVISIIAVLSVIGLVAYSGFLKNSRDAKRQSDLRIIQSALEDYHSDQIYYPFSITFGSSLSDGSKTYLNNIPKDQKSPPEYSYVPSGANCSSNSPQNCNGYCLYACFEGSNKPTNDQGCTTQLTSCPSGQTYGITRP